MAASTDSVRRWERVTVSETLRMKLNGESEAQMVHARAIKAAGGVSLAGNFGPGIPESKRCDTSIDQDWPIDASACARRSDLYVVITTGVWLGVKIPIFAVPMLVSHVLPMLVVRLYMSVLPDGTDRVSRSCAFYALYALALVLAVPAIVLIFLSYVLDCIAYYSFSLFFCTCTWRWLRAMDSFQKIRPYREGPLFADHLPDLFVALVGQTSRQTVFETTYMLACMWLLIPWLKYYVNCNPWIYDLNHRLCQQISTEMADLGGADSVADRARYLISCAREDRGTAERLDMWSFVPHYPLPPPDRRWALGLQAGGAAYPGKFTLIVHTTHAIQSVRDVTEQFVLSNCCEQPIYRVMLWYNNPYHFLTGWVEASVSNGQPSQLNKAFGGEHPMWLVTARSPLVAGRDSWTGSGMIDAFFDYWLPVFVHEMRRQVLGREAADRKYQQVSSKDGISPPEVLLGLEAYREAGITTAIDDYAEQAAKQRKDLAQPIGTQVARLAETRLGLWAARQLQRKDLHSVGHRYEGWSSPTHAACARSFNAECQGLGAQGDASGMQPESAACKRRREPADSSDEMQLSQVPLRRRRTGEASSQ